jgi:hypothetical protein
VLTVSYEYHNFVKYDINRRVCMPLWLLHFSDYTHESELTEIRRIILFADSYLCVNKKSGKLQSVPKYTHTIFAHFELKMLLAKTVISKIYYASFIISNRLTISSQAI